MIKRLNFCLYTNLPTDCWLTGVGDEIVLEVVVVGVVTVDVAVCVVVAAAVAWTLFLASSLLPLLEKWHFAINFESNTNRILLFPGKNDEQVQRWSLKNPRSDFCIISIFVLNFKTSTLLWQVKTFKANKAQQSAWSKQWHYKPDSLPFS